MYVCMYVCVCMNVCMYTYVCLYVNFLAEGVQLQSGHDLQLNSWVKGRSSPQAMTFDPELAGEQESKVASTPGPTEFAGPGFRLLILHGWSLGNAIAQKHHYDNAHKQLTVCWRSQEVLLATTSSCQHLFQILGSLHGDGTDSAR